MGSKLQQRQQQEHSLRPPQDILPETVICVKILLKTAVVHNRNMYPQKDLKNKQYSLSQG